ncbi:ArsR/SmtB family transcription factor [Hyphococcus sp. DH-69]|uniref:ArsR/SmtB family transcription factor n=1 Tax=Hyphococcus formosus TaxID=3143534 RepID=UPI00398B1564
MLNQDADQPVFRALADPTRRAIITMLSEGPRATGDIASEFEMSRPAVAKHLTILREGGVIEVKPRGRERINHLNPQALKRAAAWLNYFDQFWDERLTRLKQLVEE